MDRCYCFSMPSWLMLILLLVTTHPTVDLRIEPKIVVSAWAPFTRLVTLRSTQKTQVDKLTSLSSSRKPSSFLSYSFGEHEEGDISNDYYLVIEHVSKTWDKLSRSLWESTDNSSALEDFVQQAAHRIESIITEASTTAATSTETIQALVRESTYTLEVLDSDTPMNTQNLTSESLPSTEFLDTSKKLALDQGLDITEAAHIARETAGYAASIISVADKVLRHGYIAGDPFTKQAKEYGNFLQELPTFQGSKALFSEYSSAYELNFFTTEIMKAAEMGSLSGAIYEDTVPRTHALQQTIVARGVTEDVAWMVTDSIANHSSFGYPTDDAQQEKREMNKVTDYPFVVRTITIRGFDASDVQVDRERLLNHIANASQERIRSATLKSNAIFAHSGLLEIARAIYKDVKPFIEWTAPDHKIVLNGHSIGGSIALLVLFLVTQERGPDYVKKKVVKVYTFGSPPVVCEEFKSSIFRKKNCCEILEAFDLPSNLVLAYVQPWDPIIRQFSEIDSLYPLIEDIGEDGNTLWTSGPQRALRPITKAVLEAWNGWPRFRETAKTNASQAYVCVGIQHLLLPDPTRYLADRFLAVNIPVPPVATILRISPWELYRALENVFPLDVFEISYIPQAIRSFVHHFYPAYDVPIMHYVKGLQRESQGMPQKHAENSFFKHSARKE